MESDDNRDERRWPLMVVASSSFKLRPCLEWRVEVSLMRGSLIRHQHGQLLLSVQLSSSFLYYWRKFFTPSDIGLKEDAKLLWLKLLRKLKEICIPIDIADTMLPCPSRAEPTPEAHHRRLLWMERRVLAADGQAKGCKNGYVPLISLHGLHQLHIFIFFLAVFHVIYGAITMLLGRLKIRGWKTWEREAVAENESANDASKFRLTHETSFVRDHTSWWTKNPILFYIVCFFRQFFRSVRKADYLTMRHGFVTVHLAPGSKFNFQKYIKRSLEDDFKVVVGISPLLWASVIMYLLLDVNGWQAMNVVSFMPLLIILAVGTKLQGIITHMALEITEKHAVVQGIPLVKVSDKHFWFSWPQLILFLIHYTLFQNAFEITYFFWIWYEFGLKSCFHDEFTLVIVRVALGLAVQILCSYITLPLYALVTQMGSTMKKSVFDDQTTKALRTWQMNALKKKNDGKAGGTLLTKTLGKTEANTSSPKHATANIMATVDLHGDKPPPPPEPPTDLL